VFYFECSLTCLLWEGFRRESFEANQTTEISHMAEIAHLQFHGKRVVITQYMEKPTRMWSKTDGLFDIIH